MLEGKKILLGVTAGIAAYKCGDLVRAMVKQGADVKVVMTPLARQFVTPLTLATLSRHPILVDFFNPENGEWNSHVSLGMWADAYLIAPATANSLAKMANGVADNLLLTTYLSARCPVFVAPAMDLDMYAHPSTRRNLLQLQQDGVRMIDPDSGFLASGLEGKGRMAQPEAIVEVLDRYFESTSDLSGKTVMITAGPTYEKIDPVRFIGNYSSGKMGFALAEECAERGAKVLLVAGPVALTTTHPHIERVDVESAAQMYEAAVKASAKADVEILCAAVADYAPAECAQQKIKREKTGAMSIQLEPTRDIAAELGRCKRPGQLLVGFALETNDEMENAKGKCQRKNLDFIVLNSLNDPHAGFRFDTNKITILDKDGAVQPFELKSKKEVARDIVNHAVEALNKM